MTTKIYLGTSTDNERLYIEKHSWDCDWYWGFGYIGNTRLHMHISALINHPEAYSPDWTNVGTQFSSTWITQDQWWILRDLFISAYALQSAAEVYKNGGHQTQQAKTYRVLDPTMVSYINEDLETLLDTIWSLLIEWDVAYTTGLEK